MKRQLFVFAAGLLLAGAAAQAPADAGKNDGACADGSQKVWVTGSAIKRCVKIYGNGSTDTPSPVYVIGRSDIDRAGRNTVGDLLGSYPALR
jgi:hypothetical protein